MSDVKKQKEQEEIKKEKVGLKSNYEDLPESVTYIDECKHPHQFCRRDDWGIPYEDSTYYIYSFLKAKYIQDVALCELLNELCLEHVKLRSIVSKLSKQLESLSNRVDLINGPA